MLTTALLDQVYSGLSQRPGMRHAAQGFQTFHPLMQARRICDIAASNLRLAISCIKSASLVYAQIYPEFLSTSEHASTG